MEISLSRYNCRRANHKSLQQKEQRHQALERSYSWKKSQSKDDREVENVKEKVRKP